MKKWSRWLVFQNLHGDKETFHGEFGNFADANSKARELAKSMKFHPVSGFRGVYGDDVGTKSIEVLRVSVPVGRLWVDCP